MPPKGRKKATAAVGYQHTDEVSQGTVLTDLKKSKWTVGKPVGQGGFGVLYLANSADELSKEPQYVLKLEPLSNGPLFCEMQFYQRCCRPEMIQAWLATKKKLKNVGIPKFIGHGTHQHNGENRFLVMERFGTDLQKLFVTSGKRFPRATVYKVAIQLIYALEYIHSKEYTHADIKAANVLLGHKNKDEVYLVDFGLASRYSIDGKHQPYKPDPKAAHDGTIEFTSRDSHNGVSASRRSDVEILGYCLLQWLCRELPWENNLTNKEYVKTQKNMAMDNIPAFMKKCFPGDIPAEIVKYLEHVVSLDYHDKPDYDLLSNLFATWLNKNGHKDCALDFTATGLSNIVAKERNRDSMNEFSAPFIPSGKRSRQPGSSARKKKIDESLTPKAKKTKTQSKMLNGVYATPPLVTESLSPEIASPKSVKKWATTDDSSPERLSTKKLVRKKRTVKTEIENSPDEDDSLGVELLSPKVKERLSEPVRRSPRKHVLRITQDRYSSPVEMKATQSRKRCVNPKDVAIQTSPWLKKSIQSSKKKLEK